MRRFSFRLQRLLDVERLKADVAARETAVALAAVQEAEAGVVAAEEREEEAVAELREALVGPARLDVHEIRRRQALAASRHERVGVARDLAAARTREWDDRRAKLEEARRAVAVLERARENARAAWRAEMDKSELATLDEQAQGAWTRNRARKEP